MRRLLIIALSSLCCAGQFITPVPPVMPSWMVPYPGASAANRQLPNAVQSDYTAAAPANKVLTHFRTLFASAGLPFHPDAMGGGFVIMSPAPECDLAITIRRREPDTTVSVSCTPRLAVNDRIAKQQAQQEAERGNTDPMKKFDNPVYPSPRKETPLTWPAWLVRVDGARLAVEKSPVQLKSSFMSSPARESIQAFYTDLLNSHYYRVSQSPATTPEKLGSWVQGSSDPDADGHRTVIWVKIKPAGQNFAVDITLQ